MVQLTDFQNNASIFTFVAETLGKCTVLTNQQNIGTANYTCQSRECSSPDKAYEGLCQASKAYLY